jgi:hypothetical protein
VLVKEDENIVSYVPWCMLMCNFLWDSILTLIHVIFQLTKRKRNLSYRI